MFLTLQNETTKHNHQHISIKSVIYPFKYPTTAYDYEYEEYSKFSSEYFYYISLLYSDMFPHKLDTILYNSRENTQKNLHDVKN